jgi:hypothetical protein
MDVVSRNDLGESRNSQMGNIAAKIRTEHLTNTSVECRVYTIPSGPQPYSYNPRGSPHLESDHGNNISAPGWKWARDTSSLVVRQRPHLRLGTVAHVKGKAGSYTSILFERCQASNFQFSPTVADL